MCCGKPLGGRTLRLRVPGCLPSRRRRDPGKVVIALLDTQGSNSSAVIVTQFILDVVGNRRRFGRLAGTVTRLSLCHLSCRLRVLIHRN